MEYVIKVEPGSTLDLQAIDTRAPHHLARDEAEQLFAKLAAELADLQDLLYGAQSRAVLVVLQGVDTSGKDGTIRKVFREIDPLGCRAISFKVPTAAELAHDFLWRVHKQTPAKGELVIFNRSHYEDVLVARVHGLVPEAVWRTRYDHINAFERLLTESGTVILKFYLHISKEEQEARLLARERDVEKAWKLSASDWIERRSWDAYRTAYEDALTRCSTSWAPWYVVPADQKWFRNLAVAQAIVSRLRPLRTEWLNELEARGKAELLAIQAARQRARQDG